jgi:hypothetical protein
MDREASEMVADERCALAAGTPRRLVLREIFDESFCGDVVGTVDSLWLSAADRIEDAMLINDPDTGERRAMSPGEPSGALDGLARAATRRNSDS